MSGTYKPDLAGVMPDGIGNPVALAATVGIATTLFMVGLGFELTALMIVGLAWLALEAGFRVGFYLGVRHGYTTGADDAVRQINSW